MADSDSQWLVTLHDGSKVDGRAAVAELALLRNLADSDPGLLSRLHADHLDDTKADHDLAKSLDGVFYANGKMRPNIRRLLKNAIVQMPEGFAIGDPFQQTDQNRVVLETIAYNRPIFLDRLAQEIKRSDEERGR